MIDRRSKFERRYDECGFDRESGRREAQGKNLDKSRILDQSRQRQLAMHRVAFILPQAARGRVGR